MITRYKVFRQLSQANMVDMFLFNCLPSMLRKSKLTYCELLLPYAIVKFVMAFSLYRAIYEDNPGCLIFVSRDHNNWCPILCHDESLEMKIISRMKGVGYKEKCQFWKATSWLQAISHAFDQLSKLTCCRAGLYEKSINK